MPASMRKRIIGIDWSGAADAGRRIYIAEGRLNGGGLALRALRRAEELPGGARTRERCIPALRRWLSAQGPCAVALDFPFGLPRALVDEPDWLTFIRRFPNRFISAESFRNWCRGMSGGRELKRRSDLEARTPFSPYNLRLYRQTYWGMSALLAPLVGRREAVALPMQAPVPRLPWLLEACPASVLKRVGIYSPYKGSAESLRDVRAHLLETLVAREQLKWPTGHLLERILTDPAGDALDAVIAALAGARAVRRESCPSADGSGDYALEAFVYY